MTKPNPWRWGFCDAVMGRPSNCQFIGYKAQSDYLKGYLTGKEKR